MGAVGGMGAMGASGGLFAQFSQFTTSYDRDAQILWARMRGTPVPCFTETLLAEARAIQRAIEASGGWIGDSGARGRVSYVVLASAVPGVFNLGGDMALFRQLIDAQDRARLSAYARQCIDVAHHNIVHYNIPCATVSLVCGSALGGGMEAALSSNFVIAERSAEMGLPESLFNLFPGMGAYNLIARRAGPRVAEEIILEGRIYTAADLYQRGLVDVLAEDGAGEDTLREWVRSHARRRNTLQALARVREALSPITYEDLARVVEIWVDAALRLEDRDLRMMDRLVSAQARNFPPPARPRATGAPRPAVQPSQRV